MGKLLGIQEYIDQKYGAHSKPAIREVRAWIRDGRLKAEKHGRTYYIDEDETYTKPPTY